MASKKLVEFLRKKKESQENASDWEKVRSDWLASLEDLGGMFEKWLGEPIKQKLLTIERVDDTTLVEEVLGTYQAPRWRIRAGRDEITATPVARLIIGGLGRVDLDHGPRKIMLIQSEPGVWRLRWGHSLGDTVEANEQTLSEAIQQLLE